MYEPGSPIRSMVLPDDGLQSNCGSASKPTQELDASCTPVIHITMHCCLTPLTLCPLQNLNLADDLTDDDEDDEDVCVHHSPDDDIASSVCAWRCLPVAAQKHLGRLLCSQPEVPAPAQASP